MIQDVTTPQGLRMRVLIQDSEGKKMTMGFFHGIKESGTNLGLVDNYGPLYYYNNPDKGIVVDYNAACPQTPDTNWDSGEVLECFRYMLNAYPDKVDHTQMPLVGVSMGGAGVWKGMAYNEVNKLVSCYVPICPASVSSTLAPSIAASGLNGWAFHAKDDYITRSVDTIRMVTEINRIAGRALVHYTEYGGTSHVIWPKVFADPQFLPWLKLQRRPGTVEQITSMEVVNGNELRIKAGNFVYSTSLTRI